MTRTTCGYGGQEVGRFATGAPPSALAILALVVLAIVRIMAGICDGLTQWFGMPWAGSLGGGLIGLGIAILALRGARRSMSEANLRRMREKYDGTLPSTKE
jgi:hypothetical protein